MKRQQDSAEFLYSDTGELVGFFKQNGGGLKLYQVREATYTDLQDLIEAKICVKELVPESIHENLSRSTR